MCCFAKLACWWNKVIDLMLVIGGVEVNPGPRQKQKSVGGRKKRLDQRDTLREKSHMHMTLEKPEQQSDKRPKMETLMDKVFNETIKQGPVYVCICCKRLMYRHSVVKVPCNRYEKKQSGRHLSPASLVTSVLVACRGYVLHAITLLANHVFLLRQKPTCFHLIMSLYHSVIF